MPHSATALQREKIRERKKEMDIMKIQERNCNPSALQQNDSKKQNKTTNQISYTTAQGRQGRCTILVKVEGNETLALPEIYKKESGKVGSGKLHRSMTRRTSQSFMGSKLPNNLQATIDGLSDPCRISIWPPLTDGSTAAVTKRTTIKSILLDNYNKSTTEWMCLYVPCDSAVGTFDTEDATESNNKTRSKSTDGRNPPENVFTAEQLMENQRRKKEEERFGSLPGHVYFNPFTSEYRINIPSRHGEHDVPTQAWNRTCRIRVSITSEKEKVPTLATVLNQAKIKKQKEEEKEEKEEIEEKTNTNESNDDMKKNRSDHESRGQVSNIMSSLFCKCSVCGSTTSQLYTYVHDKTAKLRGERNDEEEESSSTKKLKGGKWELKTSTVHKTIHDWTDRHKRRETWIPNDQDHIHGHTLSTTDLSLLAFRRQNTKLNLAHVSEQYITVALSESKNKNKKKNHQQHKQQQNSHILDEKDYRAVALHKKTTHSQHRHLFKRIEIHERSLVRPSSSAYFIGRWRGDCAMRGLKYTRMDYSFMLEAGASFWPESLLLMIIQVYVLERETGVYLLSDLKDNGTGSSNNAQRNNERSNEMKSNMPDTKGVRRECLMSEVMFASSGRVSVGGIGGMHELASRRLGGGGDASDSDSSSSKSENDSNDGDKSTFSCTGEKDGCVIH